MLVVFLVLVFILSKYAWGPIINGLKERENEIQGALDLAKKTKEEMAQLKSDNERLIIEANAARDRIIKEAKEAADRLVEAAKDKATAEGNRIIESARETIRSEQAAAVAQIRKEVATLSIDIAEKVLRRELNDKSAQEQLVADLVKDSVKLN
ncbi:MAG: ATP synthase F0 subunit B [Cytophagaceae bacterium SCN 52-12]|nr:MAG: ATP synthase F0 subunit B [Cytophagaceae bacterium SCN 52-12]